MEFSKQQIADTIITESMLYDMAKQEFMELLIREYNKYEKDIQPVWVGEGWYKSVPNSFNYFASGFEAGMNYVRENK